MTTQDQIVQILSQVLQLNAEAVKKMTNDTPLLGAIAEFDSMSVVSIITALEERFGFVVEDDEIDATVFETVGSLVAFVDQKLQAN
jgi:acyl carrier protein